MKERTKLQYHLLNAFGTGLKDGNPAAVLLEAATLGTDHKLQIAGQTHAPITAFVAPSGPSYTIAWFGAEREYQFCGHATLAAAAVLFDGREAGSQTVTFVSKAGDIAVSRIKRSNKLRMQTKAFAFRHSKIEEYIERAIGSPLRAVYDITQPHPTRMLVGWFESEREVKNLTPDFVKMRAAGFDLIACAQASDNEMVLRSFYPNMGFDEDAVSVTAFAAAAPVFASRTASTHISLRQISVRGGSANVSVDDDTLLIEGSVYPLIRGEWEPAQSPSGESRPIVKSIDHIVMTVDDLRQTQSFYSGVLGMTEGEFSAGRKALFFGSQKINLHKAGDPQLLSANPTIGAVDICFTTDCKIENVMAQLSEHGVPIVAGPVQRIGARGPMISVYFRDPNGNLIEISRYPDKL